MIKELTMEKISLPNEMKKLGEVCSFQGGSQPPKSQFIYEKRDSYVRFLQIRDFKSDKNITYIPESPKNRYCSDDDILLGRYGASVGKVLINKTGAYNVAVMKTIPDEKVLFKRYLFFYFTSNDFQNRLEIVSSRSAQNGFSKNDIFDFPILVPPLHQQKQIVGTLDKAFAAIDTAKANAEQNLQNAKELFGSYLHNVFENKGDDWENKTLEQISESVFAGGDKPKGNFSKEKTEDYTIPIYANAVKKRGLYGYTNKARVLKPSVSIAARGSGTGHTELRKESFYPIVRLIVVITNSEII
jgi:type I restriction enzyme S subunit